MFKEFKVTCGDCGWSSKREEQDLLAPCPICDKRNIQVNGQDKPSEQAGVSLQEVIQLDLVENMKETIGKVGKDKAWDIVNTLTGKTRLSYINVYLEAIQDLEDK